MNRFVSNAVLLAYLAGATGGGLHPSDRLPPVDGLAFPAVHRWVGSAPSLAAQTTQPATDTFELRFRGRPPRSDLGGLSTRDDRFFVAFREGAVRPSPGQTSVRIEVRPVDPAALGSRPQGLQAVGNAYRLQVSYAPSGRPIEGFAGEVRAGFSYSLAASTALADLTVMYSRDGRAWTRLETADAPSAREATSQIPGPGYLLLATSPAVAVPGDTTGAGGRRLALVLVAAVVLVAALVVLRRRAHTRRRHQGPPAATGPSAMTSRSRWPVRVALLAVLAVWRLFGPDPERAGVHLLLAAIILVMVGELGDLDSLSRSQLAVALPTPLTRALAVATLGLGAGLAVVGLRWSQRSPGNHRGRGPATKRGAA
jgi:hypothetical protein